MARLSMCGPKAIPSELSASRSFTSSRPAALITSSSATAAAPPWHAFASATPRTISTISASCGTSGSPRPGVSSR
eukprot:458967-Prymnesium_polylepis.1